MTTDRLRAEARAREAALIDRLTKALEHARDLIADIQRQDGPVAIPSIITDTIAQAHTTRWGRVIILDDNGEIPKD